MTTAVKTTITALVYIVQVVPIGTNISLVRLMWAMVTGSFLSSRGAVHGALAKIGLEDEEIRRSWSALSYGSWNINELLSYWHLQIASTNEWEANRYGNYRVKSIDTTGFWRPQLKSKTTQHYSSLAQRALPAIVFGIMVTSGTIKEKRVPRLEQIVRCPVELSETEFKAALMQQVQEQLQPDEIAALDSGFGPKDAHEANLQRYVVRMAANCTARINRLPEYKGGRRPEYGELIRPLSRTRLDNTIAASKPEGSHSFEYQGRTICVKLWRGLVTTSTKVADNNPTFSLFAYDDPHYKKPMVLASDMTNLSAELIYLIYRDRWTAEHPPLAAKQMIGLHRQFVFGDESRFRLPELALLVGNVLSHCAAILPPAPTGYWDRAPKSTPGRLRNQLSRSLFPNLADFDPQLRKKNSVFHHLPTGIDAHRRQARAA